jgi:hypothetical protein
VRYQFDHPKPGQTRLCVEFLFLPQCINGEARWLEWAAWTQIYGHKHGFKIVPYEFLAWIDVEWK